MARKISLLVVVLVAVVSLSLVLTACGGSDKTATTTATTTADNAVETTGTATTIVAATDATVETTEAPVTTEPKTEVSTEAPTTTVAPDTDATKAPETTSTPKPSNTPNEDWINDNLFSDTTDAYWVQPHMTYTLRPGKGDDGKDYDYIWYFTIKAEGGHFTNTAEDHPTHPNTPGIQMTVPYALFIKDVMNDDDYTKYELSYWKTAQWYEIWCVADGFVPEDGAEYDIYLVFTTPDDLYDENGDFLYSNGATYPNSLHYIWDLGATWVYTAPQKSESKYLSQAQLDEIKGDAWWLLEHEPTTLDAEGNIVVKFKSDGQPFSDATDTYGVAFTAINEIYINGEKYEAATYETQDWYILKIKVKDFAPTAGETYEIIITLNSTDATNTYTKYDSYYVLVAGIQMS